jgi:hypothetical protein
MPVTLKVPISTAVIEDNPRCLAGAEFEDDAAIIRLDARKQNHHEILGLPKSTKLHWSNEVRTYEAQELSSFPWPIRYRVTTADAWYTDAEGNRAHYTPPILGLDSHAKVSHAVRRAAVLLIVIGAIGYRRAAWLLEELFRVSTSKSSLSRWVKDVAQKLPTKEEMVRILDERQPITEIHFDEIHPRGKTGSGCVLVGKDEHGRIFASREVDKRDEASVRAFLRWLRRQGLKVRTFYIDTCQTYRKVIPEVFEGVRIQLDYFHIIQNVWRHLWKFYVGCRKAIARRAEKVETPWYKAKLKSLAKSLWTNRYLVFKAEERLNEEERTKLVEMCEVERKVGRIRAFLSGVWHIFEDSSDEAQARQALEKIKAEGFASESKHHERAVNFLEETFHQATTYLREKDVRRNSLAESGMRNLRRLEIEHDGFRTEDSRDDFLRIYQAVKYLGWFVHGPLPATEAAPS